MTMHTEIIIGPPGTGKTTRLLDILDRELKAGVPPNKIAFMSFTNKAVDEATDRAVSRCNFKKSELVYFRTVHSMAFFSLGLKRTQVMQLADYRKIGDHLGLRFTAGSYEDGPAPPGKNPGDHYRFIDSLARAKMANPKEIWDGLDHDGLNWYEFDRYRETVKAYKKNTGLYDFSDMLRYFPKPLDLEVCIIDEAQDLSTAQWSFISELTKNVTRMYIGGDDDQAIFEWGGADVNKFINLEGERTVLDTSYRIPASVHKVASGIASKIQQRTEKTYHSRSAKGSVEYSLDVDSIDMSSGTWMLLARNSYLLGELAAVARQQGYSYSVKGVSSVKKADTDAIECWEKHRKGLELGDKEHAILDLYTSNTASDAPWFKAFDKMSVEQTEYYLALRRRGESLLKTPRIKINTIHGSKGGEADHVVLVTDMAYTTWNATNLNQDSEHRVWYVGATRAKESLNIIMPRARYHYPI